MPRLRLYDARLSRLPQTIGLCSGDINGVANRVNTAQRRLLYCKQAGDEGWYGTFAEVAFNGINRANPYITTSRNIARIEAVNVCDYPVAVNNQYVEYLDFGSGRLPKQCCALDSYFVPNVYRRNAAVTFVNLPHGGMKLRVYSTDPLDAISISRIFLQGTDVTDAPIYSEDNGNQVQGVFYNINTPFVQTAEEFNVITGIQKDVTKGQIQIFAVDSTTGEETLLLTMEPGETVAGYQRYYFDNLPHHCCPNDTSLRVTAIVKLELIPVVVDTDYLLFHNLEAIIEECVSVRLSEIDSRSAKEESIMHHIEAVRYLNGELVHYYGKDTPAVSFKPFGSARLERLNIGMM